MQRSETQSTVKSTSTSQSSELRNQLLSNKRSYFDDLFPLLHNVVQYGAIPGPIVLIFALFMYIQLLYTSLWPKNSFYENMVYLTKVMYWWGTVFWFVPRGASFNTFTIVFVACLAVLLLSSIIIAAIFIQYKKTRRFNHWTFYPVNFVFQCIVPIMELPLSVIIGYSFTQFIEMGNIDYLPHFIVSIILLALNSAYFYISLSCYSKSIFVRITLTSSFDALTTFLYLMTNALSIILTYVLDMYAKWTTVIIQVIHLLIVLYLINQILYVPFHSFMSNSLMASIMTSCAFLDIVLIVGYFIPNIPDYIPLVCLAAVLIISFPVFYYIAHISTMKICRDLTKKDDEAEPDFSRLKLLGHNKRSMHYFRVGFFAMSDLFLDWSLLRYLMENTMENDFEIIQLIALFPSEYRKLSILYSRAMQQVHVSFANRFLLFQVNKVNTLRQFSNSSAATEKLSQLKGMSMQFESAVNGIFISKELSIRMFEDCVGIKNMINSFFLEALLDYPNNPKLCDEYCRFLIESAMDFEEGIRIKNRSELIESGHNFAVDHCFKEFVRGFPQYLKRGVLDEKGNFIKAKKTGKGSSTSSGVHSSGSTGVSSIIDIEVQEQLCKALLINGNTRLSLHNWTKSKELKPTKAMPIMCVINIVINMIIFIVVYFVLKESLVERKDSLKTILLLGKSRFYVGASFAGVQMIFTQDAGLKFNDDLLAEGRAADGNRTSYLRSAAGYNSTSIARLNDASTNLYELNNYFSELSVTKTVNIFDVASAMFFDLSNQTTCVNGEPLPKTRKSLITVFDGLFFTDANLVIDKDYANWYQSNNYCQFDNNYLYLIDGSNSVFDGLNTYEETTYKQQSLLFLVTEIVIPIVIFGINFIPYLAICIWFLRIAKHMQSVFIKLDNRVKELGKKRIMKNCDIDDFAEPVVTQDSINKPSFLALSLILTIFLSACIAMLLFGMIEYADTVKNDFHKIHFWQSIAIERLEFSAEAIIFMTDAILLDRFPKGYATSESMAAYSAMFTKEMVHSSVILSQGNDDVPPMNGYDSELDALNLKEPCVRNQSNTGLHEMYRCANIYSIIDIYGDLLNQVNNHPRSFNGTFADETTLNILHIAATHLWRELEDTTTRLYELSAILYDEYVNTELTMMVIGLVVSLFIVMSVMLILSKMKAVTFSILAVIKRLPPIEIVNNKDILNFLLDRNEDTKADSTCFSRNILWNIQDSVIIISPNGTITMANPATTETFGYKLDQVLGQSTNAFFASYEEATSFENQMKMMLNRESAPVFESHVTIINDSSEPVPCQVTLLLMMRNNEPTDFVMSLKDESELVRKQKLAEESKAKSENLLYNILPRDIVIKLNSGEKEIAFTVPSASIIFIDIQRFSEYAASLTPSEIMAHLSQVFHSFDEVAKKYPLITKIKLIGDDYMAASGLFSKEEDPPVQHAEQIVKFGLDCLSAIDENNVKLNSNLAVRIGINSGGPLIAGVLGSDKPVFDIIGDPINIAARLQTTDVAGKIQISQNTYDLIQGLDFACEPRGEVYLKGKGKSQTYLVLPINAFILASMSSQG